ncbi:MAG: type III-B CRISPR-associated protein Cas10/Cmr2 [Thiolinea sp.]
MSTQQSYFHFTLGPVQSFVAQARRTRDFWAGSFILSGCPLSPCAK